MVTDDPRDAALRLCIEVLGGLPATPPGDPPDAADRALRQAEAALQGLGTSEEVPRERSVEAAVTFDAIYDQQMQSPAFREQYIRERIAIEREQERAAVVAYLRGQATNQRSVPDGGAGIAFLLEEYADRFEHGEHVPRTDPPPPADSSA